jgi:hypothetical protein
VKLRFSGKAGRNVVRVKRRKLHPGRYKLTIVAVDPAGNRSKAVTRRVGVKR